MTTPPRSGASGPAPSAESCARVAVIVVTYNAERDIAGCLESVRSCEPDGILVDVVVVDNASQDATIARVRDGFPEVTVLQRARNEGFAAGANIGIRAALERGADFVYLLNPDTVVAPAFLREALAVARAYPDAGAVQSLLLLEHDCERVNTWGNAVQFLGFGHCGGYGAPLADAPREPGEIACASGAGSLFRVAALEQSGLLDDELFLYQEDLDLSWRLRLAGWLLLLAPRSIVLHKYAFSKGTAKYYYLERNRLLVLAKNLSLRSLVVLAPVLLVTELGMLGVALCGGWLGQKLRATGHLLRPRAWAHIARGRREQRRIRAVSDREIVRLFTPVIEFEGVTTPVVRVANSVLRVIWRVLGRLIT